MTAYSTMVLRAVPANLRHALTRWMIEPASGVFVGNISAKVRDQLWAIVTEETQEGWALLIHSSDNEQGYIIRSCGTERRHIIDLDGLQLVALPAQHLDNPSIPKNRAELS